MERTWALWFSMSVVVLLAAVAPLARSAEAEGVAGQPVTAIGSCDELIGGKDVLAALAACRRELMANPDDLELVRRVAGLEAAEGNPDIAAGLYVTLLDRQGWSPEIAHLLGATLWRAGRLEEAESVLRDSAERAGTVQAHADLIGFLAAFDRWPEAKAATAVATAAFPEACELRELEGVAEAGAGRHGEAAAAFAKGVEAGCPRYRWATLGPLPELLDEPAYRPLMDPARLVEGLDAVDDREAELRLALLAHVVTPAEAPAIADQVIGRDRLEVRYAGLGLLTRLGVAAFEQWPRLLAADDFILRKLVLRRIREIGDPAFVPLLARHLEAGKDTPGNLNLTRLALGELLLAKGDVDRAGELLAAIPADDPLYAVGRVALADHAEAAGDLAAALEHLEQAMAASREVYVDRDRLDKLRRAVAEPAP